MASHNFTITQESVNRSFTITQDGESRIFTINTGVGPAGISAVTNATVNAAIEEDPAATRDSLELGPAALEDFSNPPPIGDGTPNTGAFTTISATGTATLPHIHGSIAGNLYIHVRNDTGSTLTRGTPIYITGNVGDTDRVRVAAADNTNTAKMPAVGLLEEDLDHNEDGNAIIVGELDSANTNAYSLNQELYVGAGAITGTKPTTGEVQSVGVVSRVQTNTGVIVVNMQGRRTPDGAFAAAIHTHVSADITDATASATPSRIVKRNAQGGAEFAGTSGIAISATSTSATAVNAISTNSTAVYGESGSSDGGFFASDTGTGLVGYTDSGDYHAKFGDTSGDNRSFVTRVSGAFGWWRGAFRGLLQAPASITTSDKTWTLPNNTGTVALTTDEMTPTSAGLTSKFGTNKASVVNGDKITILDSAASDAPKHILWSLIVSTLTTAFDALYVGLTGNQTVAGNKTLSGQLELTGQAATNSTSAMTRDLADVRYGSIIILKVGSDFSCSSTSTTPLATVTGMTASLEANTSYEITGFLGVIATGGSPTTNRVQFRFGYSGSLKNNQGFATGFSSTGALFPMNYGNLLTSQVADVFNLDRSLPIIGYLNTDTSGTFSLTYYKIQGSSNPTLKADSIIILRKINL